MSGAPWRMIVATASSTNTWGTSFGKAHWISSTEMRPVKKKSLAVPRPASGPKILATAFAVSRTEAAPAAVAKSCDAGWCSTPVGTGKSGKLKGTRSKPSWNCFEEKVAKKGRRPCNMARAAIIDGTERADNTSALSMAPSACGQPTASWSAAASWCPVSATAASRGHHWASAAASTKAAKGLASQAAGASRSKLNRIWTASRTRRRFTCT
mmetsp:Transcript_58839/g.179443  ORF Transcript_58839/g.179443 Transcript_58839/m.179443 type:complete len:211 (+) Transcript_58839:503-1135(+)